MVLFAEGYVLGNDAINIPPFVGDWKGTFIDEKNDPVLVARVFGLGEDDYGIQILQELDKRADLYLNTVCKALNDTLKFDNGEWNITITEDSFKGTRRTGQGNSVPFELKKVTRQSPTMGLSPPPNSIILFNGSDLAEWIHPGHAEENPVWELKDGVMIITPGFERVKGKRQKNDLITKLNFLDIELHLEFCVPYQPDKRGQGRGNSGIFLQDFYEVQILDSYGSEGLWNDCGALYKLSPPKVNASYPPGQWQTYDIIYQSPKYDKDGNITHNAVITVKHNGVLIQNNTELIHPTANSQAGRSSAKTPVNPAPIKLQDHGNPVKFRNIWVKEL